MQFLLNQEWVSNDEIYLTYRDGICPGKFKSYDPKGIVTYGYCELENSYENSLKTFWMKNKRKNELATKNEHVMKQLVHLVLLEHRPPEANIYLSTSLCFNCCELLLEYVSSFNCKLNIYFSSIYKYDYAKEARGLQLLNQEELIKISTFTDKEWEYLLNCLNQSQYYYDKTVKHWQNEWNLVFDDILTKKIIADPSTGKRLNFYKPKTPT